jgi:hypothetical protein
MATSAWLVIFVLLFLVIGEWIVIWRLLNRLLIQARVPSLGPVMTMPPKNTPERKEPRRPIMRVKLDPFDEEREE